LPLLKFQPSYIDREWYLFGWTIWQLLGWTVV